MTFVPNKQNIHDFLLSFDHFSLYSIFKYCANVLHLSDFFYF